MTVTSILSVKRGKVVSIEPAASLETAAACLAANRIGAVIVLDEHGDIAGILSERDIVRAIAARGIEALHEPVSQSMTRDVATCGPDDPIEAIMERMTDGKFRHMPVVDGDRMVGIVSIGDVVKDRLDAMEHETRAMRDYIQHA